MLQFSVIHSLHFPLILMDIWLAWHGPHIFCQAQKISFLSEHYWQACIYITAVSPWALGPFPGSIESILPVLGLAMTGQNEPILDPTTCIPSKYQDYSDVFVKRNVDMLSLH